ncbi:Protein NEOXANTHIN-DEFICIENT 1, partial [Cucurbita argyrosperma subsp. argyrosperma]
MLLKMLPRVSPFFIEIRHPLPPRHLILQIGYPFPLFLFQRTRRKDLHGKWREETLNGLRQAAMDIQRKAKTARKCIPKELRLVEAFGYTLGGFFLANYDDSPAGSFDELVVIAGIVWNRPTSCAYAFLLPFLKEMARLLRLTWFCFSESRWAAKVLVNSDEACDHGRKEVGLPSQVARFTKRTEAVPKHRGERGLLNSFRGSSDFCNQKNQEHVQVTEVKNPTSIDVCNINLSISDPLSKWMGPAIRMSLPSYRVRAVKPAAVAIEQAGEDEQHEHEQSLSTTVLLSKPILALEFSCMEMQVQAPTVVSQYFKHSLRTP